MFIILACVAYELTKKALYPKKQQQSEERNAQLSASLSAELDGSEQYTGRGRDHTRRSGSARQQRTMNGHAGCVGSEVGDSSEMKG